MNRVAIVLFCTLRLVAANYAQSASVPRGSAVDGGETSVAAGEPVTKLDERMWIVFQDRNNDFWFGSDGQGVYRYNGKALVRYTTEHGLGGNHVRGIQEDRSGNVYVYSDPGGVSRFDGRAFGALRVADNDASKSEWTLEPDDLWFPAATDTGAVYRFDGKSLHRLTFPKTAAGEAFVAAHPRSEFPNAKYSPYDVYTVFKDSKGHVWFGTSSLGACRFDGKSHAWADQTQIHATSSFGLRSIIEDRDGKFWFSNTLNRYALPPAPSTDRTSGELPLRTEPGVADTTQGPVAFLSAIKDKQGDLWLATLGAGVWHYDGKNMTNYPVTSDGKPIWTYSIYQDRQGILWLGTQEHGLYRFSGKAFEKFRL